MVENLVIGGIAMAVCLMVQCLVVILLLRIFIYMEKAHFIKTTTCAATILLFGASVILLLGNFIQITLWASLFYSLGEFGSFATACYHSIVNFATLGYGDLVMSEERRLLGGMEAANGVLMFGLTTSFLFTVLSTLAEREWKRQTLSTETPAVEDTPTSS